MIRIRVLTLVRVVGLSRILIRDGVMSQHGTASRGSRELSIEVWLLLLLLVCLCLVTEWIASRCGGRIVDRVFAIVGTWDKTVIR